MVMTSTSPPTFSSTKESEAVEGKSLNLDLNGVSLIVSAASLCISIICKILISLFVFLKKGIIFKRFHTTNLNIFFNV